jgi:hypothetical protein
MPLLVIGGLAAGPRPDPAEVRGPGSSGELAFTGHFADDLEL